MSQAVHGPLPINFQAALNQQIPARLEWATSIVAANLPNSILEIGFGRGIAIARLATLLPRARIVGIDRSSIAFQAATLKNVELIKTGRCSLQQSDMLSAINEGRFDAIVAVNVNVFWTTRASEELALAQRCSSVDGLVYLFYETPSEAQRTRIEASLTKQLRGAGLELVQVLQERLGPNAGLAVIASLPSMGI